MASTTLSPAKHSANSAPVKSESGFWRNLFTGRTPNEDRDAEPFAPDEQSRWAVEQVRGELHKAVAFLAAQKRVAGSPTDLDGSRPAYLLRHIGMLALDGEIDPELTFQGAIERLQSAWNMLLERAAEEKAFERHTPVNAVEAAADGALLGGMPSAARARVVVTDIVGRSLNAPKPTALQVAMTPDVLDRLDAGEPVESVEASVTATAAMSPVHVPGDGTHAPLPDDEEETADPGAHGPLPRRTEPVNVLSAADSDPYTAVDPADDDAGLVYGSWIGDEGGGVTGPVWFKLARRHVEGDGVVRLDYCSGLHVDVPKGRQVQVLDPVRALELLAQHDAALAARAAERAA